MKARKRYNKGQAIIRYQQAENWTDETFRDFVKQNNIQNVLDEFDAYLELFISEDKDKTILVLEHRVVRDTITECRCVVKSIRKRFARLLDCKVEMTIEMEGTTFI